MPRFSLSALGVDRPGIVAAVSGVLADLGGNLEDSTMTILQGHFAILLVVSTADHVDATVIEEALEPVARQFDLVVAIRPLGTGAAEPATSGLSPWTISVHGADRPGIVHGVAAALATVGGNVVDLSTHLVQGADGPLYVMTLRITLPSDPDPEHSVDQVRLAAEALGVHCTVHADDSDTL